MEMDSTLAETAEVWLMKSSFSLEIASYLPQGCWGLVWNHVCINRDPRLPAGVEAAIAVAKVQEAAFSCVLSEPQTANDVSAVCVALG